MYFDMHSDSWNHITIRRLNGEKNIFSRYHLEKLKKGNIEGSIYVIWVDPPYDRDYDARTKQIIACIKDEIAETKDFRIVRNIAEIEQAKKDGIFYVMIGVEGMAYIGNDLSKIDDYYDLGARHAILTWNEANALGGGALSGYTDGLTPLGKQAVKIMQDKGMMLDVSHLNDAGFYDLAKITEKPFIASHSNCRSICNVPRNLTDDQLRVIRDVNGVVGINCFNIFLSDDPAKQDINQMAVHMDHMINVMGIDHVACGFDLCDFMTDPTTIASMTEGDMNTRGFEDHTKVPELFRILKNMGLNDDELEKIAYRNAMRVIKDTIG